MLDTARSILDCIDCQLQKGVNIVHIIDCCRGQYYAQYSLLSQYSLLFREEKAKVVLQQFSIGITNCLLVAHGRLKAFDFLHLQGCIKDGMGSGKTVALEDVKRSI